MASQSEHQLGDFIKGRFLFIEEACKKLGRGAAEALLEIKEECLRLAETPERRAIIEKKLFGGSILSSSILPDWVDKVFLEAMSNVLRAPGASPTTTSSKSPCVAFEAGRFNAKRQAATVFRPFFSGKKPADWLRRDFPIIYRQCYGPDAAKSLKVEELALCRFRVTMDNRGLEKACPLDCSTTVGYLFGSLEALGAKDPVVNHTTCCLMARQGQDGLCVFELAWREENVPK